MSNDSAREKDASGLQNILQRYTTARVALGQTGPAVPTQAQLLFQLDHALARDAIHTQLDTAALLRKLHKRELKCIAVQSAVPAEPGETARTIYLRRPDLGRALNAESEQALQQFATGSAEAPDVVFVVADGLSALAVEHHALPLLDATLAALDHNAWRVGPIVIVSQGRVAIGDAIGSLLRAKLTVMLLGERPGLSTPDSLGVYITWEPRPGRTDAERNCISNIHLEGVNYVDAAARILFYMNGAKDLQATGIGLKENTVTALPAG
ncbi:MAG TPA: ethanolamine ammonia-lyase subunit EutC [Acidobacteriaceae bacterium]|nr:ethanolamine ammonia-lyase subunit EutC [Acidobacteriaceae bacterium]